MVEKKLRFWYEKDEKKRKRTPKVSPKVVTPKVVIKGKVAKQESQKRLVDYSFECYTNIVDVCIAEPTKKKSPPKLVDEPMVSTIDLIQEGVDLMKMTLDDFVKQSEAAKAVKDTEKEAKTFSKNVEAEGVKETLVEGTPKKKKDSDKEDSTYIPTPRKRKANPSGVVPRSVRKGSSAAPEIETTTIPEDQSVKAPEVEKAQGIPEVEKAQSAEVEKKKALESPIFERVEKNDEVPKNVEKVVEDVEVEYMGERQSTPPINPIIHIHEDAEEQPKKDTTSSSSHGFPRVQGEYPDDLPKGDYDMFNDGKINVLTKKVILLEKAKAKAEVEREELKEKLKAVKSENAELKKAANNHAEIIDQLTDDLEEQNKVIDRITAEFDEVNEKFELMNKTNKTLHQMIGELHETSSNESKVLRQEIETLRADKVVKDEQLNMLYTVIEHKLGFNVQVVFDELEIQRVEERRVEREKQLAEEAKQKKKRLVIDKEEILGSLSQPDQSEAEGTIDSNPLAVRAVGDVIGVTPEEIRLDRRKIIEKPHEEEEKKKKDAELEQLFDDIDNYDPNDDNDDDDDQGATRLLVVKPSVQQTLDDFLNDELNEQQEDQQHKASSSGKQHAGDQVFLTQPKVIYLHASFEGELEVERTTESMLDELGMEDGHMMFDIEDEIPLSPEREYSFKFANEADNFKDVIIEEGSVISDEDTPFHYSGVDDTFPTFAEMFKTHNEDEVRRKVVERISSEGVPETVPQEELLEGQKKWFKVMPKERKYKSPLQYFTISRIIQINLWVIFFHGAILKIFKYMLFEGSMEYIILNSCLILKHSHGGMWKSSCKRRTSNNSTMVLM
ncbi:putative transcription factor bZIP family [Helianthus annuus]|uniref:Transcription factor bZIP family n=1 Tax=Helianthus annuus TaxID=4232 RepID=A0A9K3HJC6_HELAN|nr:putative transcription factor bZIP family [Helianthus annuus]KAJ0490627.1 putative transcription factor bZIP family [Helianthus annuus]KAJ0494896.1 putative transcription factor bZIP family [Helianthus annuus]KAJ0506546.1 putative transcription factor bZIP family [Helianthus annuus]KAJ0676222.1 putative transcription factor bZIP family [Helianthus annuus]